CIVGDVVYGAEEPVPADQPCLKCKCQPPGVQCETTKCIKKPGCRAIHKSNKCCPEYQCECEHEGRLYANGERLETPPGGECRVCYCRGGEVQCAEVSCYIRTDCEESAVPVSTESDVNTTETSISQSESRYEDLGESKLKHDDDIIPLDQNPEYPPIPDIMSPQNVDELSEHIDAELAQMSSSEEPHLMENSSLVINESLSGNINESVTILSNKEMTSTSTSTSHPLINAKAALPASLLRELAPSDNQDEETVNSTTEVTESDRSKETLESTSEESGESTTPQNKHASIILSVEDASVETPLSSSGSQEIDMKDLVETISGMQTSTEETKDKSSEKPHKPLLKKDVELINPQVLMQNFKQPKQNKTLNKPEARDESDIIFEQLNEELKSVPSRIIDNNTGNEDAEAEAIFKELFGDATSSTISPTSVGELGFSKGKEKETELMERVSDAITKFQMKESKESLDTSILGILRDFFNTQSKYHKKEK
ncbi:hypothetical protein ILUMI_04196, partial [Ignelater luminosus]